MVCLQLERDQFLALAETPSQASSVFRQGLIRNLVGQIQKATERFVFLDRIRVEKEDEYYKGTPGLARLTWSQDAPERRTVGTFSRAEIACRRRYDVRKWLPSQLPG